MGVIDGLCSISPKGTMSMESRDFKAAWLPKPLRSLREVRSDFVDHSRLARRATPPTTDLDWFCVDSRAAFRRCRSAISHRRRFYRDRAFRDWLFRHQAMPLLTSSILRVSVSSSFAGGYVPPAPSSSDVSPLWPNST